MDITGKPQPRTPARETGDGLRTSHFAPRRRRWPGLLAAGAVGAGIAAAAVSSFYDPRPVGARVDAGIEQARQAASEATTDAAASAAAAAEQAAIALVDTNITAAVKAALAADPALSALRIEVSTHEGVVRLVGPAPDAKARSRAEVLASAPQGVVSVDNQLVVTQ